MGLEMFKAFRDNEDGNFAMMSGLTGLLVLLGVGMAFDTSGMTTRKSQMQNAVDSATLSAALQGGDKGEMEDIVEQVMMSNFAGYTVETKVKVDDDILRVTAKHDYEMMMMGMFDHDGIELNAMAEVPIGGSVPIEVAFALDVTQSMETRDSTGVRRIDALQDAANEMVDTLESRSGPDVRASVVPFSNYVNIGTDATTRSYSWLDLSEADRTRPGASCRTRTLARPEMCFQEDYQYRDDNGNAVDSERQSCPDEAYDTHPEICEDRVDTWRGCIGSRIGEDGLRAEADSLNRIKGVANSTCPGIFQPMTSDLNDVRNAIDGLNTEKHTYIPAGLIWAWRSLTPSDPYPNISTNSNSKRAVVLMTDGNITMYQDPGRHEHHSVATNSDMTPTDASQAEVDKSYERMRNLCTRIKNTGIHIYTIGFDLDAADTRVRQELRDCASNSGSNFNPDNSAELSAAFVQISDSLYDIRLSR